MPSNASHFRPDADTHKMAWVGITRCCGLASIVFSIVSKRIEHRTRCPVAMHGCILLGIGTPTLQDYYKQHTRFVEDVGSIKMGTSVCQPLEWHEVIPDLSQTPPGDKGESFWFSIIHGYSTCFAVTPATVKYEPLVSSTCG